MTTSALEHRILPLEAEHAVRYTLSRYMHLCDQPCAERGFPQLQDLFTDDAIWEGVGTHYAGKFGQHRGAAAIIAFIGGYLAPSAHFKRNHHFMSSEQIRVASDCRSARGQWLMLQISTYADDSAEAITARLSIDFLPASDGRWLMSHFRTERLECAPWQTAASEVAA